MCRKLTINLLGLMILSFIPVYTGYSQSSGGYLNYSGLTQSVKALADKHQDLVKLESFGKSAEGRDLWVLTIAGKGDIPVAQRQAMLVAANFEGDHLIGGSLALATAEYLVNNYASDEEVRKSIEQYAYYIIPRINPDGAETMFEPVKSGRKTNTSAFDADNDGRLDEDGPEDLNHDGQITVFRVKDANGLYRIDPEEPMLMKKADASKGERGEYSLYPEGIDNDQDGFINEDPAGGTDLNRNFMHAYPYYKENAGRHMVSEPETRAMMEWMLAHRNVAIVLTYGESDNLITAPNSKGALSTDRPLDLLQFAQLTTSGANKVGMVSTGRGRFDRYSFSMMGGMPREAMMGSAAPQTATTSARAMRGSRTAATTVNTADLGYFTRISEKYKELTGIKTAPVLRNPEGAFFQYAYFQFGVPSFSTPGWGLTLPPDTTRRSGRPGAGRFPGNTDAPADMGANAMSGGGQARAVQGGGGGGGVFMGPEGMGPEGPTASRQPEVALTPGIDATYLKYLKNYNPSGFIQWQTATHPEYGEIEIGGFAPTDISNPPFDKVEELGTSHAKFAVYLTSLYAQIKIATTEVVNEGGGLFRIKTEISNEGFLPTALRQGVQAQSVKPTMVQLGVKPEQILSGSSKTNFFQSLDGSGKRQKYEWLIKGKAGDRIELNVVSEKAGIANSTITLK